ncbi:MAG: LysM peptidoglycan-binding domain-containing protein, partial [Myxococcota bacterium]
MAEPSIYVVQYGDYLVQVARDHGTTWQAIWTPPHNAAHRRERKSPDVLYPGDVLAIPRVGPAPSPVPGPPVAPSWPYPEEALPPPPWPTWTTPGGVCECHPIDPEMDTEKHRVRLFDHNRRVMPSAMARVRLGRRRRAADVLVADAEGVIEIELNRQIRQVVLEWAPQAPFDPELYPYCKHYFFVERTFEPVDIQRRLHNLGFWRGRHHEPNLSRFRSHHGAAPDAAHEDVARLWHAHDAGQLPATDDPLPPAPNGGGSLAEPAFVLARADGERDGDVLVGTAVPPSCRHPRSLRQEQLYFDQHGGSSLPAAVRTEFHQAVDDVVAATGGNFELALGLYHKIRNASVVVEMGRIPVAARFEEGM